MPSVGRLHIYAGLFFLAAVWFFSLSGLLLNHPQWEFKQYWPQRKETITRHAITPPANARELMRQLGISGEVEETSRQPAPGRLDFRVARPGLLVEIQADLEQRVASVKRIETGFWGAFHALHLFTGVRLEEPARQRDWLLTSIWSGAIDVVAAGLVFMTLSGIYLWWKSRRDAGGWAALLLGLAACGAILVRW